MQEKRLFLLDFLEHPLEVDSLMLVVAELLYFGEDDGGGLRTHGHTRHAKELHYVSLTLKDKLAGCCLHF
jgi:hypothetical protein